MFEYDSCDPGAKSGPWSAAICTPVREVEDVRQVALHVRGQDRRVARVVVDPARVVEQPADADVLAVGDDAGEPVLDGVVEGELALAGELQDDRRREGLRHAADPRAVGRPHRRLRARGRPGRSTGGWCDRRRGPAPRRPGRRRRRRRRAPAAASRSAASRRRAWPRQAMPATPARPATSIRRPRPAVLPCCSERVMGRASQRSRPAPVRPPGVEAAADLRPGVRPAPRRGVRRPVPGCRRGRPAPGGARRRPARDRACRRWPRRRAAARAR